MSPPLLPADWPAPPNIVAFTATRQAPPGTEAELLRDPRFPGSGAEGESIRIPALRQVHGTLAVDAGLAQDGVEADALYCRVPGIGCRVLTADCLPLLLCDLAGTEIAAIHAGWRGLAAGIIESTLAELAAAPASLLAWLGPAISQPHYEVGPEVREQFLAAVPAALGEAVSGCFEPVGAKYLADLAAIARARLAFAGVRSIHGGDACTFADARRFHSWRRDGAAAGRLSTLILMRPPRAG